VTALPKDFPKSTVALIYARTQGYCEKCGNYMRQEEMNPHHRQLKSQGGKGVVENGLGIHHECHRWVHDNPADSYKYGWMIPNGDTPLMLPVLLPSNIYARLTNDGRYDYL
jgi:hypothetical protein